MKGVKLRLSRTFVLVFGGVVLLVGGSGAAAVFFASDKLFGPAYSEVNGLECTTLQVVKIKKDQRYWVRKYVVTEKSDGITRLKTALRVAKAVQTKEKADLVQVTVLDKAGPTQRAEMRGRAIGAQVVYIPDVTRAPNPGDPVLSAYYVDGAATPKGEYFGLRRDVPIEDAQSISASLTDSADCVQPVVAVAPAEGHGEGEKGKGKGKGKGKSEGHGGEAASHGEAPAAHGEEKPEKAHEGEKPAAEGHGTPAAEGEPSKEGGGLISSLTSMVFGGASEAASAKEGHAPAKTEQAHAETADPTQPSGEHTAVAEQPGMFSRFKSMIFGGEKTTAAAPAVTAPVAATDHSAPDDHAAEPAAHDGIDPMKVSAPTEAPAVAPPAPPPSAPAPAAVAPAKPVTPAKPKQTTVSH